MAKKVKAKKKKATAASAKRERRMVGFSVSKTEQAEIQRRADKYASGNVSAFMRHAAFTCKTGPK